MIRHVSRTLQSIFAFSVFLEIGKNIQVLLTESLHEKVESITPLESNFGNRERKSVMEE